MQNKYVRTDLAAECPKIENGEILSGIKVERKTQKGIDVCSVEVLTDEGARTVGKPVGRYTTLSFPKLLDDTDVNHESLVSLLSGLLRETSLRLLINNQNPSILVIGLGNRFLTPDSIGPLAIKGITVTRQVEKSNAELFSLLNMHSIAAISPGVSGQTGIESFEIVKSTVDSIKPDLVIAIDALASKSVDRLACTIQLGDNGIAPGSGIGNTKKELSKATLGIPVIALGVPTMVSSATLVYDALEKAGLNPTSTGLNPTLSEEKLEELLNNKHNFYVTLNECDIVVNTLSKVISQAINQAFSFNHIA